MALEGIAALGVASNIVQFVEFGCRLFSESKELYRSSNGQANEAAELEKITRSLGRLSDNLIVEHSLWKQPPSNDFNIEFEERLENILPIQPANARTEYCDETDLVLIATDCKKVAVELSEALNQLRVTNSRKKWQCFRVTLKRIWKPQRIYDMSRRMELFSSQMTMCLVKIFNTKQWEILSSLRDLSERGERLESTTNSNFENMRRTTLSILEKLEDAHRMKLQDVNDRDQIRSLQLSQLSSNLENLKEMGERSATEFRLLESLRYQRMEARQEKIADTHAQTFEWIFDPHTCSSRLPSKDNFVEWLDNGNDIFWITGKAGSGKSTLMKFLSHHKSSTSALQRWADEKELVTAAFYFWNAGNELQKSQEGLLQSLLHGILSQCPKIIPQVLPKRWEQCTRTQSTSCHWTRAELLNAFAELSHQCTLNKRFCFFMDGLDEYDGDHSEVVDLVQGFAKSKDIKVCLSSRPWNVFTRAFGWGSYSKLHLEYLTQRDIKSYVQDTLGGNNLFCQLAAGKDSARCKELEDAIVSRAQGVFLWVFLVVRSLMEGLTNADRITDLERRLQSLPTDLEAYFRHMLENIEDVYVQQTVKIFSVALHAVEPLSLMTYAMMDEIEENPRHEATHQCSLQRPVANHEDSVNPVDLSRSEFLPLSKPDPLDETLSFEPNLTDDFSKSDLFSPTTEPAPIVDASASQNTQSNRIPNNKVSLHPFFQYEVDFLHRTVKDFFQVNDVQTFLASPVPETFDSCALLCHALLAQIKVVPSERHLFNQSGELPDLIEDLAHYAHQAETQTGRPSVELLDELSDVFRVRRDSLLQQWSGSYRKSTDLQDPTMSEVCQSFLGFAVQRDLQLYVTHKLDERLRRGSPAWENFELLHGALETSITSKYGVPSFNRTMLRILVDRDVDLDRPLTSRSIWDHVIGLICPMWASTQNVTRIHYLEIVTALLDVGAEPNRSPGLDRLRWVQFILIPSQNWRTGSTGFEAALTRTIVAFCERRIDPYWEFEGYALWCHFIRSIYDEGQTSAPLSLETKKYVLIIIKKFMGLGAQLDDMVYHDTNKYDDGNLISLESLTVTDVLNRIYTKGELDELEPLRGRKDQESSKAKISGEQRRKKKKRRRERWKVLGH